MKTKRVTGVNVGGASILVIFVLLCLTTFATLSLISANADYALSQKAAQSVSEYYGASAEAESLLAQLDECLAQSFGDRARAKTRIAELAVVSGLAIDFTGDEVQYIIPAGDVRVLKVTLGINFEDTDSPRFTRREWKIINTADWEPGEDFLDLWDGSGGVTLSGTIPA